MPLLTKTQKRTTISALRSSNVRAIEQNYNEPARLWCNEEWVTSACLMLMCDKVTHIRI